MIKFHDDKRRRRNDKEEEEIVNKNLYIYIYICFWNLLKVVNNKKKSLSVHINENHSFLAIIKLNHTRQSAKL